VRQVKIGDHVVLPCVFETGPSDSEIRLWVRPRNNFVLFVNNTKVTSDDYTMATEGNLIVHVRSNAYLGDYECKTNKPGGPTLRYRIELKNETEIKFLSKPVVTQAQIGEHVVLPCAFETNLSNSVIRLWLRPANNVVLFVDNTRITSDDSYTIDNQGNFTVHVRTNAYFGDYECKTNLPNSPVLKHRIEIREN